MENKCIDKFEKLSSSVDELVKNAFYAGIVAGSNGAFVHFSNYSKLYISRRNYGATSDSDMNLGNNSSGEHVTYDMAMNNRYFKPISKDFAEKQLADHGVWRGYSNSGYNEGGFNRRAVWCDVITFYYTFAGGSDIVKKILTDNGIEPDRYKDCVIAANWLADEVDEDNAYAMFVPVFNDCDERQSDRWSQVHNVLKPLILKVPKNTPLQYHECFEFPLDD